MPWRNPEHRPAGDVVRIHFFADKPNELRIADIIFVPAIACVYFLVVVTKAWSCLIAVRSFPTGREAHVLLDAAIKELSH